MTSLQLNLSLAPLPTGTAQDANQYGQALVSNLTATLNGNILQGQTSGQQPITDVGPWFDGTTWWFWDGASAQYLPVPFAGTVYNVIGNAAMAVMQRPAPANPTLNGTYVIDRFKYLQNLLTGKAAVAQTSIGYLAGPDYPHNRYALRSTCTVSEPAVGANEYSYISQSIMSGLWRSMVDKPTAFSLLMTSSVVGTFYVTLRNRDDTWCYLMPCVIAQPNVPQRFEFNNIPAFPSATGNWGNVSETDFAYEIMIILAAGASFRNGVSNIWNGSNQICGPDQTNFFSAANNKLDVTLIQHQPGPAVTPFVFKSFADDLWDCQTFFSKSYDYATAPGSVTTAGQVLFVMLNSQFIQGTLCYPRRMRTIPTVNIYSSNSGAISTIYDTLTGVNHAVVSVADNGESGFSIIQTSGFGTAAAAGGADSAQFQYTADADA